MPGSDQPPDPKVEAVDKTAATSGRAASRVVTFNEVYLSDLRARYLASKNPLYVWYAIHWCLNESPEQPLPDWCKPYLAETARRIIALGSTSTALAVFSFP